ncbi:MAG: AAA family ATPase [Actinomycetota bacterium]|nr:AAA family ATPase [Actinomycetota bacterium]
MEERLGRQAPLAERMRPRSLDEVVGQQHLLGPGAPLRTLIEADRLSSLVLWGPPGTGKTTLARASCWALEVALVLAPGPAVTVGDVEAARSTRALRYEEDDHYDVVSAFIKSIRGSDPDAGLYWLARMLAAGEDARFIARRLVVLASEDVGLADSTGLLVADAAARAVDLVGLPEARLNLAHAVVYLATAPKSNRATVALGRAQADVANRPAGPVPAHLRDSHYRGAERLGHGVGYEYPHDDPRGWLPQQYRPHEVSETTYYEPSGHGQEREIDERMSAIRREATG